MTRRVYLSRPALINALGRDSASVAQALFAGRVEGMVTEFGHLPFAPQRPVRVGRVADGLPTLPSGFVHHESRNNRLLLAAAHQLQDVLDAAIGLHGPGRVGVVLGTSTSGIAFSFFRAADSSQ